MTDILLPPDGNALLAATELWVEADDMFRQMGGMWDEWATGSHGGIDMRIRIPIMAMVAEQYEVEFDLGRKVTVIFNRVRYDTYSDRHMWEMHWREQPTREELMRLRLAL
jgi:hypothetical protein